MKNGRNNSTANSYSRADKFISMQFDAMKINKNNLKPSYKISRTMNINTSYSLNYPKFNYLAEAIDRAMARYQKKTYIPEIEHGPETRCKKILSLFDRQKEKLLIETGKQENKKRIFNVKKKRFSQNEKKIEERIEEQSRRSEHDEEDFGIKGIRFKKIAK